jgi:ligand-binding sensor domain-containing protein
MHYDERTGEAKQLDVSEKLKQETVTNIVEDLHHRLWINTFNGLYSYNLARKVVNHITTANGLPSSYLNYSSGYVDPEGVVYIGTYKGMIVFNPTNFVISRERLRPYFLTLTVNGRHIIPNDDTGILKATLFQTKELKLTRDQNTFSIDYAVPTYQSGEIVWYRYRLNPDEPWVVTDNAQPIQLTNLSTGTYRITLQASYNPERWEGEHTDMAESFCLHLLCHHHHLDCSGYHVFPQEGSHQEAD